MYECIIPIRIKTIPFCAKYLLSALTVLAVAEDEEVVRTKLGHRPTPCCQHAYLFLAYVDSFFASPNPLFTFHFHHLLLIF